MVRRSTRLSTRPSADSSVVDSASTVRSRRSAAVESSAITSSVSASASASASYSSYQSQSQVPSSASRLSRTSLVERRVHFGSSNQVLGTASGVNHSSRARDDEDDFFSRSTEDDEGSDSDGDSDRDYVDGSQPRLTSLLPYDYSSAANARTPISNSRVMRFFSSASQNVPKTPTAIEAEEDSMVYRTDICDQHEVIPGSSIGVCRNPMHSHNHNHAHSHSSSTRALKFDDDDSPSRASSSLRLPSFTWPKFSFPSFSFSLSSITPSFLFRYPYNALLFITLFLAFFALLGLRFLPMLESGLSAFSRNAPPTTALSPEDLQQIRQYLLLELRQDTEFHSKYLPRVEFYDEKSSLLELIRRERTSALDDYQHRLEGKMRDLVSATSQDDRNQAMKALKSELELMNQRIEKRIMVVVDERVERINAEVQAVKEQANKGQEQANKASELAGKAQELANQASKAAAAAASAPAPAPVPAPSNVNPCKSCDFSSAEFQSQLRLLLTESTDKQLKSLESTVQDRVKSFEGRVEELLRDSHRQWEREFTQSWQHRMDEMASKLDIQRIEQRIESLSNDMKQEMKQRELNDQRIENSVQEKMIQENKQVETQLKTWFQTELKGRLESLQAQWQQQSSSGSDSVSVPVPVPAPSIDHQLSTFWQEKRGQFEREQDAKWRTEVESIRNVIKDLQHAIEEDSSVESRQNGIIDSIVANLTRIPVELTGSMTSLNTELKEIRERFSGMEVRDNENAAAMVKRIESVKDEVQKELKALIEQYVKELREAIKAASEEATKAATAAAAAAAKASAPAPAPAPAPSTGTPAPAGLTVAEVESTLTTRLTEFWSSKRSELLSESTAKWSEESAKFTQQWQLLESSHQELVSRVDELHTTLTSQMEQWNHHQNEWRQLQANIQSMEAVLKQQQSSSDFTQEMNRLKENEVKLSDKLTVLMEQMEEIKALASEALASATAAQETQKARDSQPSHSHEPIDMDSMFSQVKRMITEALERYSADRTALVDYALKSSGGRVIAASRTHQIQGEPSNSLIAFVKKCFIPSKKPDEMLIDTMSVGSCWPMAGQRGFAVIQLRESIIPTAVSIQHIDHSIAPDYTTAPKNISIYGIEDTFITHIESHGFNLSAPTGDFLGNFEYIPRAAQLQTFDLKRIQAARTASAAVKVYQHIAVQIHSNHGNSEYTCIYRVRVHGEKPMKNTGKK